MIQHPRADDHASRMLSEVSRQIAHSHAKVKIMCDAGMSNVESRLREVVGHRIIRHPAIPNDLPAQKPCELFCVKAKHLANFACR